MQAYVTFTHNGQDIYTIRTGAGYKTMKEVSEPVPEGEYACYVHTRESKVFRTGNSNVISIYSTYLLLTVPSFPTSPSSPVFNSAGVFLC